jgi:threonine dehydratase
MPLKPTQAKVMAIPARKTAGDSVIGRAGVGGGSLTESTSETIKSYRDSRRVATVEKPVSVADERSFACGSTVRTTREKSSLKTGLRQREKSDLQRG